MSWTSLLYKQFPGKPAEEVSYNKKITYRSVPAHMPCGPPWFRHATMVSRKQPTTAYSLWHCACSGTGANSSRFVLRLPRNLHIEVHKVLCLPRNLHLEVHKVLCLPQNLHINVHKVLCLPRNLHIEVHKVLRCHELCTSRFTKCCACHDICISRFTRCGACDELCTLRSLSVAPATKSALQETSENSIIRGTIRP